MLVYSRVHPGPARRKWSGSSWPKREHSHIGLTVGAWMQRNAGSPISIVAGYFPALLAEYIPAQGVAGETCGYDAEVQTAKPQKGRSWYL